MNSKWTNLCALLLMTLGLSACGGGGDGGSDDDVANNDGSALGTPSPPIDEAPLDEAPLDEAPLDEAPLDEAPLDGAPLDGAPLDEAPLDEAPLDEAPLDGAPVGLAELPNPPLTEGPSADDEPVAFDSELHTITQFQALRDTGPRISKAKEANEFTQEDFDAGLPDAVITVPNDVDPETNAPPFFEGLANVRIEAGQTLQLLFDPVDPEGDLPGMFGQELPPGASFDDNRDGTRTLEWTPLQGDVGITEFTAVAIDPDNSNYRSSQMVLIAVDEPSNLAGIPNVPPGIEPVADYTVRVGDPVSIFLIGTDRNGTVPTIELQNPPPSAILTPDPRTPEIQILQVVPDSAGTLVIDILTRDADDPLLTGLNQITLEVLDADAFERGGERLRNAVAGSGVAFGSAVSPVFYLQADGGVYEAFAGSEFGVMSPESSMKWDAINPLPGRFEWADMDTLLNFAEFYDMEVRGHTLIWYTSLPSWVEQTEPEDREVHMREYITRVMTRYADRVDYWDVVNEPISEEDGLRDSIWFEAMGEGYIDTAFLQARELAPNATLVLNEFDIGFAGRKFDDFLSLIDRLLEREVPVDAIGFQMHVFSSYDQYDEFAANMAEIAARGLDIHVTELDVAIVGDDTEEVQAEVYERVAETCLAQPRCTVLQTWGFTDRYSFRRFTSPLYLDENHQVKPSYDALRSGLSGE